MDQGVGASCQLCGQGGPQLRVLTHDIKTPPRSFSHGGTYGPVCVLVQWGKFPIANEAEAEGDSGTVSTFPCKVGCDVQLEAWGAVRDAVRIIES